MMINIGLLKLDLFLKGIKPLAGWEDDIILILPENTWVTVSQKENSPYEVIEEGNQFELRFRDQSLKIKLLLRSPIFDERVHSSYLIRDILHSHGGYLAAAPRGPCRFAKSGFDCKYCGSKAIPEGTPYTDEDFLEALEKVLEQASPELIHLSSGFSSSEDGGMKLLEPLVKKIRERFNLLISVDVMPPAKDQWIDRTYAAGADMVYYDLDVFDPTLFAKTYPEKEKRIRQARYLEALEYAVKVFPSGAVTSHLVLGLEPYDSTQKGIDVLTDLGVVPLLTFFPPQEGSDLAKHWDPDLREIVPLYAYLYEKISNKKLSSNWIRQIDVVLTPLEGRHFVGGKSRLQVAVKNFYHTTVGRKAAYGFSSLRRKLKMKG